MLVPPAPRAVAQQAAREVLGTAGPVDAPLVGHGPRARARRYTRALVPAVAVLAAAGVLVAVADASYWLLAVGCLAPLRRASGSPPTGRAGWGTRSATGTSSPRSGSLNRHRSALATDDVIGWNFRASWFQRRAGLTHLVATTAGGSQRVTVLDVPEPVGVEPREPGRARAGRAVPRLTPARGDVSVAAHPGAHPADADNLGPMFSKVLVANRGEIAIRAFRAAYELGVRTVAVFPYEDRRSEHRLKADEAYEIGERGHPVRAYLDPDAIVATAVRAGADAVYPGYGFLSENPALAEACANAGITFVGPTRRRPDADRQQGPRDRGRQGRRRPDAGSGRAGDRRGRSWSRRPPTEPAVPALREGGRRRRRPRHAQGRRPEGPARGGRDLHARGRGRLRRPDGVHRAGGRRPPAHRGADPRRRRRQRDPPVRAGLLGAAPPPEGRRDRARRPTSTPRSASGCARTRCGSRPRSATSTPAPSSSCSTRRATTSSSR